MHVKRVFNGLILGLVALIALEILTGLILLPFYHPSAGAAYESVKAIQANPALYAVENAHHWISAGLIVGFGAALLYGIWTAAHRENSRWAWVGSVLMLILMLLLQLTGHLLPWDQHAVRTAAIETGIAGGAPGIGTMQAKLLRGGSSVGPQTLTLWFVAHVALLSASAVLLGLLLVRRIRFQGLSPKALRYFNAAVLIGALLASIALPVHLGPGATAADYGNYSARPEWYVLPLHSLLNLFQEIDPSLGYVGSMVVPGLAVIIVLALPWLEKRYGSQAASEISKLGIAVSSLLLAGCAVLFFLGSRAVAKPNGPNVPASDAAFADATPPDPALVKQGAALFATSGCTNCHSVGGNGGHVGPVLDGTGSRHPSQAWQAAHLSHPSSVSPGSMMPDFADLGQQKVKALAAYLTSLK